MTISRRHLISAAASGALAGSALLRPARAATPVRIGILNDQSGVYADFGGKWSVAAAQMAVEDFGGSVLDRPVEVVDGRSSEQARRCLQHRAQMVRRGRRRRDHGADHVLGGAGGAGAVQGEEEDRHRHRCRDDGADRQAVLALRVPLGLRHAFPGRGHRRRAGGHGGTYLVLHHRRLRLRLLVAGADDEVRGSEGRQGAGRGSLSARHSRLFRRTCWRQRHRRHR